MARFPEWLPLINGCHKCLSPLAIAPSVSGNFRSGNAAVAARYFYRLPDCPVLVVISQPFKAKKRDLFGRNPFGAPAGALFPAAMFI